MRVVVCHRQKTLVHLARINAQRHGVEVIPARNGIEVLALAKANRPDMIILGNDLEKPTTDETLKMLKAEPELRGVQVVIAKGITDLASFKNKIPSPWPKL